MSQAIIIGAGPAGLFAAETLAQAGVNVAVYDHKPSPARKFLMAGRGGLNITHSEPFDKFMTRYGDATDFLRPALTGFTPQNMRDWCTELGEETFIGSSGRIFPKSFKASPLLRAWLRRLDRLGVTFHFNQRWIGFGVDQSIIFQGPDGTLSVTPDALLLALGGASWPRLGSDGAWLDIMAKQGIVVAPFEPANCGFQVTWSNLFRDKFAGTPLKSITLTFGDQTIRGELMMTTHGVEGGGIYALSSALRHQLHVESPVTLVLDLKPDYTLERLTTMIAKPIGGDSFSNHLRKMTSLSPVALGLLQEDRELRTYSPDKIAKRIKHYPLTLSAPFGLERAISSAGGIAREEVNNNYMLSKLPGIFVAGEMIDWEAPTGGYLLQASFATAHAAANGIIKFLKQRRNPQHLPQ